MDGNEKHPIDAFETRVSLKDMPLLAEIPVLYNQLDILSGPCIILDNSEATVSSDITFELSRFWMRKFI